MSDVNATSHRFDVAEDAGERLDLYVARQCELSRTQAATLIANQHVDVNGTHPKASYRTEAGDTITGTIPPPPGLALPAIRRPGRR